MTEVTHSTFCCRFVALAGLILILSLAEPVLSEPVLAADPILAGYDEGFFIESSDRESSPFSLKCNFQFQLRYTGFGPEQPQWVDAAGEVRPILERSDFDINRGRIIFSGTAIDPELNYYVNLDFDTLSDESVSILLGWLNYRFSRYFDLYFGKGKVPGSREWLVTSMATQSLERSMATTFFRPSITTGVWARGEPVDGIYYQATVGNGFNTASSGFRELDTNFVYSAKGHQNWKCTLDATYVNRSPTEQIRTGYEVGASGLLMRAQMQATF
jgi:hypothetical protein